MSRISSTFGKQTNDKSVKSASKMYGGINRLALNDLNKHLLVELELLPVLQQMLSSSNQVDVAYSLEILFTLSFSKKNAVKLATEFDKPLKRLQDDQRWNESKVLQSLVFHLGENKSHPRSVSGSTVGNSPEDLNQVMISYNHASKPIVKRLYNRLCESGLNVWVDFKDLTKGSTLDAMSDAVESSCLVLMCATRLYKESNNCRLEAEYAWKCNKKLIPVLMEPKYKATGWLGILMGTQLYYDLTEAKYPFEQKYPELLAAILQDLNSRGDGSKSGDLILDPPPVEEVGKTRPKKEDLLKWDAARVRIWCREHSLPDMRFGSITGSELHFLAGAKRNSPEYFGRLMERYFKFEKLLDLAKFANALDEM